MNTRRMQSISGYEEHIIMRNDKDNYEDIIDHPHHVSKTRPRMSMQDRAAQFSPFAALTGYDEAISETVSRLEEDARKMEEGIHFQD